MATRASCSLDLLHRGGGLQPWRVVGWMPCAGLGGTDHAQPEELAGDNTPLRDP